ncbi:hypothetical protein TYRP_009451 [Tyrophagus putrescentiae]|nr:hypothetical protein TYRP_009451 [Tyrophagus putrescentiae]
MANQCPHKDSWCFVCASWIPDQRKKPTWTFRPLSDALFSGLTEYFGSPLNGFRQAWAPQVLCKNCYINLMAWLRNGSRGLSVLTPAKWNPSEDHLSGTTGNNCFFCSSIPPHGNQKAAIPYFEGCVQAPVLRENEPYPVRRLPETPMDQDESASEEDEAMDDDINDPDWTPEDGSILPYIGPLDQNMLDYLIQMLQATKDGGQFIGSFLLNAGLLLPGTKIDQRHRNQKYAEFFAVQGLSYTEKQADGTNVEVVKDVAYCTDISGLLQTQGIAHHPDQWRLYMDGSRKSFKCLLLHNEVDKSKRLPSILLGVFQCFLRALFKLHQQDPLPAYEHYTQVFNLSAAKLQVGAINGPDIRKLVDDPVFADLLKRFERSHESEAWQTFVQVERRFFGKDDRPEEYQVLVEDMIACFQRMNCTMPLKLHLLADHLDLFPVHLGTWSDQHGERGHQETKEAARLYGDTTTTRVLTERMHQVQKPTARHRHSKNRRFAAAIGVSFMVVEVEGVSRRYAAAIGRWVIIPEGSGRTPPLRGGYWSIFYVEGVNRRFAAIIGVSFMVVKDGGVNRRFAAVIGVSFMVVEVGGVNRRFAAVIGVSFMVVEDGGVNRRFAAVIGVSFMVVEVGGVNRRFAAVIGVSFMVVEDGGVNRRFAAVIGGWVVLFDVGPSSRHYVATIGG